MYLVGKGHEHMGPGTSMVQRIDWSRGDEVQMNKAMRGIGPGLGCAGLGCAGVPEFASDCRQMERYKGMGCGCRGGCGLGLFDGGFDPATWGLPEWGVIAVGAYVLASTVFATGRAVRTVRAIPGERRKRKAAAYRAKALELTKKR